MKGQIVKVLFSSAKQRNGGIRDSLKDRIMTGYLSEEFHRKLRRLNMKKAQLN